MSAVPAERPDVVVFGATSFVGRILCRHLAHRHGFAGQGPEALTWAIAGRSRDKLDRLVDDLGEGAGRLPVLVADAHSREEVSALAALGRVVVSTVGPYALHGSSVVAACAEAGTDYLDLSGETQWLRRMIDAYHDVAVDSGARLVPASGFDSVPSDLGVHALQQAARERTGEPASRVRLGVRAIRGGVSGGTLASLLNSFEEVRSDPTVRRQLANPYALCPPHQRRGVRQPNVTRPVHDDVFGRWVAPFVMAIVNTRVVHRTNALTGYAYGEDFVYDEVMMTGPGPLGAAAAAGVAAGLGAFLAAAATPGVRRLVDRLAPDPGDGPSPDTRRRGFYDLRLYGRMEGGDLVEGRVTGDRDPGYGSTARMLGEAAACLALDVPARDTDAPGGFWTPASLLGDDLVGRLEEHAGMTFEAA